MIIAGDVDLAGAIGGPGLAAVFEPAERHAVRDSAARDCCSYWRPGPGKVTPGARDTSDILKRGKRSCDYSARMGRPLIGEATWSASGEGERLWFVGTLATIRVPGEAVGGRYALIEFLFPKHASPPRHTHPQDESYIVIEGHLTVHAGGHRFDLETGGAATVPMGVPHTFRVDSETARVLVLSTPAGLERFVRDGGFPATAATLPPADAPRRSAEELAHIFQAHGQINVGPPLTPDD